MARSKQLAAGNEYILESIVKSQKMSSAMVERLHGTVQAPSSLMEATGNNKDVGGTHACIPLDPSCLTVPLSESVSQMRTSELRKVHGVSRMSDLRLEIVPID